MEQVSTHISIEAIKEKIGEPLHKLIRKRLFSLAHDKSIKFEDVEQEANLAMVSALNNISNNDNDWINYCLSINTDPQSVEVEIIDQYVIGLIRAHLYTLQRERSISMSELEGDEEVGDHVIEWLSYVNHSRGDEEAEEIDFLSSFEEMFEVDLIKIEHYELVKSTLREVALQTLLNRPGNYKGLSSKGVPRFTNLTDNQIRLETLAFNSTYVYPMTPTMLVYADRFNTAWQSMYPEVEINLKLMQVGIMQCFYRNKSYGINSIELPDEYHVVLESIRTDPLCNYIFIQKSIDEIKKTRERIHELLSQNKDLIKETVKQKLYALGILENE